MCLHGNQTCSISFNVSDSQTVIYSKLKAYDLTWTNMVWHTLILASKRESKIVIELCCIQQKCTGHKWPIFHIICIDMYLGSIFKQCCIKNRVIMNSGLTSFVCM